MNFGITIIFIKKTSQFSIISDYKHTIVKTQVYYTFYSSFGISCIYTLACDSLDVVLGTKLTCIIWLLMVFL